MEDIPFDPFGDWTPDYTEYQWNPDDGLIYDPNGEVFDSPVSTQASHLFQQGHDPNESLKTLLEQQFQASRPEPTDPADVMPEGPIYARSQDKIFFHDSAFARSILCSEQGVSTKELEGFIIMPAKYVTRIRSRAGNHGTPTPIVYLHSDEVAQEILNHFS